MKHRFDTLTQLYANSCTTYLLVVAVCIGNYVFENKLTSTMSTKVISSMEIFSTVVIDEDTIPA